MDVKKSNRCVNSFKDNSSSEKGKNRDKFRFNKKGQVTIFIILGIVILFTVSAILYISYKTTTKDFETGEVKTVATVPVVFEPVQSYVENCLHQVAKQGLVILGGQGGYIYPNLLGEFSEKDPTNSEGININPTLVPYWHFNSAPNSVDSITCASNKPKLYDDGELGSEMSVEAQLGRYVKEKIGACLGDYSGFKEQGFEIDEENSIEVVVKVAEKGVIFKLKKSLEVTLGDTIDELDSFYVNIPLKLKHYYELAEEITKKQKSHNYLENHIMNAVVSYSSLDTKKLPPTTMVTFDMINSRFWPLDDVENRLKSILNSYLPMLQVLSAHNIYYFEYPVVGLNKMHQKNYDNMILPIDGAQDVEVRFDYFGWEPFIDVNDVDGVVKPEDSFFEGFNLVSYGIQRYDTVYDLSYPVVVSIDDPVAFENEGYRFIIALEGNIRGNREAICGQTRLPTINLFEKPLVCERNHKTVGPLKTSVIDSWTSEPIEAVRVGFTVPNQDECYMGSTDENGIVNQNYPAVYGGLMNFISLDYLTNYYSIDTYPIKGKESIIGYAVEDQTEPKIKMNKFKTVNVTVMKTPLGKCATPLSCTYSGGFSIYSLAYTDIECKTYYKPEVEFIGSIAATAAGVAAGVATGGGYWVMAGGNTLLIAGATGAVANAAAAEAAGATPTTQCFFEKSIFDLGNPVASIEANYSLSKYHDYYFIPSRKTELNEGDVFFVTLKRISDVDGSTTEKDYTVSVKIKPGVQSEMKLVPGIYEVSGTLTLKGQEIIIPEDTRSIQYDVLAVTESEDIKMDATKLDGYIDGRLQWEDNKSYLVIKPEDLYQNSNLEFNVPTQGIKEMPAKIEVPMKNCGGVSLIPGTKLFDFEACSREDVFVPGLVLEEMQMMTQIANVSFDPNVRPHLEPRWS